MVGPFPLSTEPPPGKPLGWARVVLLAALALGTGCVGSGVGVPFVDPEEQGTAPRSFEEIQLRIFDGICAPACHSGPGAAKGLNLESGRSLASLVGVTSSEQPGMVRVAPGRASESYLIVKLDPSDSRRVGNRMPRSGPPFLFPPEIRAIRAWIDAGAEPDWEADDAPLELPDDPFEQPNLLDPHLEPAS